MLLLPDWFLSSKQQNEEPMGKKNQPPTPTDESTGNGTTPGGPTLLIKQPLHGNAKFRKSFK
jgi:hypothetical protein